MTAKQRVMALRFLEKQKENSSFAKKIGVDVTVIQKKSQKLLKR